MDTKRFGEFGEKIAEKFLRNKGYKILDRNFSYRMLGAPLQGEIDIVAKKDDLITFVEVKTLALKDKNAFLPEDKVDGLKQRKISKLAEIWLEKHALRLDSKWQIDILAISINPVSKIAKVRHFKGGE